jgi:O-antigen/teichoic acid export membrane protein
MQGLGTKMAKGAIWLLLFKLIARGLGLISTIILARLLLPSDFGLVAMAMSIIAVLELLSAFNFDVVLIQNQQADRKQYDTAWTFNVLFGLGSALLLAILALPASHFYNEPRLDLVIYFLAIGYFAQGFENIGVVDFRKTMQFNKEFKFLFLKKFSAFSVTVPLAFFIQNYWALVAGMIVGRIVGLALSYIMHPYRPRLSLAAKNELFNFSKWLLLNNVLTFFRFRFVGFIIGRLSGSHALGIYNVAFDISNLPTTEMIAPINRAVLPGYSKISENLKALRQGFLNVISVIALFALPAAAGIAVSAELIVKVLLGPKWLEAIPIIQILAYFGAVTAMQSNIAAVFLSLKNPKVLTMLSIAYLILLLPLMIFFTLKNGALGAAQSYIITALTMMPVFYIVTFKYINLKFLDFLTMVWRPMVSVFAMHYCVFYALIWLQDGSKIENPILLLLIAIFVGVFSYSIVLLVLWVLSSKPEGAESFLLEKTKNFLRTKIGNRT